MVFRLLIREGKDWFENREILDRIDWSRLYWNVIILFGFFIKDKFGNKNKWF